MAIETGAGVNGLTVSRASARLAYALVSGGGQTIWRMKIPVAHEKPVPPTKLLSLIGGGFAQQYSPDGAKFAFETGQSGSVEIWVCSNEGQDCGQLTSMGASATGVPTWSPDGKKIAFYSNIDGNSQIYVIPIEGGGPRRLTSDSSGAMFARWSRNGEWIYFSSKKSGASQIWKVPSHGGEPVQVTRRGGLASLLRIAGRQMALLCGRRHRLQFMEDACWGWSGDSGFAGCHSLELCHRRRRHLFHDSDRPGICN